MSANNQNHQPKLEEARSAADFLDRVFNEIAETILIIDPRSYKVLTFNQAALDTLELKEAQLLGMTCHQLFYQRSTPCEAIYKACPIKEVLKTPQPVVIEYEYTNKNNRLSCFEISVNPVKDKNGTIGQIAFMLRDISHREKASQPEDDIPEVAGVSKLYDRIALYKQLKKEMSRSRRYQRPLALALIGIDNQDIYGKLSPLVQQGFLVKTTKIISDNIRKVDRLYSYGKYDFALTLPETEANQALVFAKRLKQQHYNILSGLKDVNKLAIYSALTLSVGIAEYTPPDSVEIMVKKAEAALKQAQNEGNAIQLWNA